MTAERKKELINQLTEIRKEFQAKKGGKFDKVSVVSRISVIKKKIQQT